MLQRIKIIVLYSKDRLEPQVTLLKHSPAAMTPLEDLSQVSANGVIHNLCGEFLHRLIKFYFPDLQYLNESDAKDSVTKGTFFM